MSINKREDGTLYVEEYTYMEYCQSIQTCIQAGYEFSFENRDFPTHYSAPFTAGFKPIVMKDRESVEITKGNTQTSTESPLEAPTSPSKEQVATTVPEVTDKPVTAAKTTPRTAKKTT